MCPQIKICSQLHILYFLAVSLGTAIGLRVAVKGDDQQYFNEAMSRTLAKMLTEEVSFFSLGFQQILIYDSLYLITYEDLYDLLRQ